MTASSRAQRSKGRVLVTTNLPGRADEVLTAAGFEIVGGCSDDLMSPHVLRHLAQDVDGIVCVLSDTIDRELLESASDRLRVVANIAVGYNNIDVPAAHELGVVVCNTPGVLDAATADLTLLLILAVTRRANEAEAVLRSGAWSGWRLGDFLGPGLDGATLGIVGYGRIGQEVAKRARAFGMTVIHNTRSNTGLDGWTSDLDELFRSSDVISLNVPLTPQTHHLVDARRIALMRPHAVLVNTARGPIVDEQALAEALQRRQIFGAGLDVFEREPIVHPALLEAPRTVLLPHIGSATTAARTEMARLACTGVVEVLAGLVPMNLVR